VGVNSEVMLNDLQQRVRGVRGEEVEHGLRRKLLSKPSERWTLPWGRSWKTLSTGWVGRSYPCQRLFRLFRPISAQDSFYL
jgi:hypothetical protein